MTMNLRNRKPYGCCCGSYQTDDFFNVFSCRKGGFFVDLFVRVSNQVAVNMYKRLGYSVYRTVIEYYSASNGEPDEDAYGELCHKSTIQEYQLSLDDLTNFFL